MDIQVIQMSEEVTLLTQSRDQLLLESQGWNERLVWTPSSWPNTIGRSFVHGGPYDIWRRTQYQFPDFRVSQSARIENIIYPKNTQLNLGSCDVQRLMFLLM